MADEQWRATCEAMAKRRDVSAPPTTRTGVDRELPPLPGQVRHLETLADKLGREPYRPPNRAMARIEINRLQQVVKNTPAHRLAA